MATLRGIEGAPCYGGARNPEGKAFVFGLAARGRMGAAVLSDGSLRLIDAEECCEIAEIAAVRPSGGEGVHVEWIIKEG